MAATGGRSGASTPRIPTTTPWSVTDDIEPLDDPAEDGADELDDGASAHLGTDERTALLGSGKISVNTLNTINAVAVRSERSTPAPRGTTCGR